MILTNFLRSFEVVILCLFAQFSSFPECISLPVPKSLCPTFGSFSGSFPSDFQCCLDEYRCPIPVTKSILGKTTLQHLRVERSPVEITTGESSPGFSEIPHRRTRTLDTLKLEVNLCEFEVNTIQPYYGTQVKSGEKIQILQIPVLVQTVVQYTCSGEPAKLIRGNCVQQYKPEELYTVSTVFSEKGESSVVIKRDFVWVEAGCETTVDLTSFIPELSKKRKLDTSVSLPTMESTPVVQMKKQTSSGLSNQEFPNSFLTHSSSISENKSSSVELRYNSAANSNPKFTSSFSTDDRKGNENFESSKTTMGQTPQENNVPLRSPSSDELLTNSENNSPDRIQTVETSQEILNQKESSKFVKINESSHSHQSNQNKRFEHHSTTGTATKSFSKDGGGGGDENIDISGDAAGLEHLGNQLDTLGEQRTGTGLSQDDEHLQGISNKIGLPLFIHSFEFDPVKNLISS